MQTIAKYEQRMSRDKHTPYVTGKLNSLAKTLSGDFELSSEQFSDSLVNIFLEVTEHLNKLDYYADQFDKLNAVQKKMKNASEIRHKILLHANSVSNYKLLIEALTSMPTHSHPLRSIPSGTERTANGLL